MMTGELESCVGGEWTQLRTAIFTRRDAVLIKCICVAPVVLGSHIS